MTGFGHGLRVIGRQVHLLQQREGPSEVLRGKIAELEKFRKRKKSMKKDQFIVDVPESNSFLDTPSMPMILTAVGIALFAKLLMMIPQPSGIIEEEKYTLTYSLHIRPTLAPPQLFNGNPDQNIHRETEISESSAYHRGLLKPVKLSSFYDESRSEELIERKIKNAPPGQGTVRMLSREEWEEIREVRPRTPFESKLARPNARIRTGEPLHMEDLKDWTVDVVSNALTRAEESVRHGSTSK
uniref:Uncharacterized protein n=1 Tax=Cucumis melo TaxID=3656 RepID=A0A9I9DYD7_CUCME